MSIAIAYSRACVGLDAPLVTVETHLSNGVPKFSIVGLAETAVKESKDRVRSALLNSGFDFPTRRITVNLAPADLPKEGGRFDLPIALGILAASGQIPSAPLEHYEFAGELALSGELKPVEGMLSFALNSRSTGRSLIVPNENADEAALPGKITLYPAEHLVDVCAHLTGRRLLEVHRYLVPQTTFSHHPDLEMVCEQQQARRALEISAAGGHSLLFIGPPGTGKTMLASCLPSILPEMTDEEALEVAVLASICHRKFNIADWRKRPFRAPHHTASSIALVGGGNPPRPGEISLAHHGVLFLDELPEFQRQALESLREPLESGSIIISRAARQAEFPAKFQLIAAMNPCPCGHHGNPNHDCRCTPEKIERYRNKLSGPFLDRIDMHVEVPALPKTLFLQSNEKNEGSKEIRRRVIQARKHQSEHRKKTNAELTNIELNDVCSLSDIQKNLLNNAMQKFGLSLRSIHRILRIARTIADLAESSNIQTEHLTEAIGYRRLDRCAIVKNRRMH